MKKISALILAAVMLFALAACGETSPAADSDVSFSASGSYRIGVCQLTRHPALDRATKGFKDALTEEFGDRVVFNEKISSGDFDSCSTIINGFLRSDVDLIFANSTPALQAAAKGALTTPVLGASVTDFPSALGLSDFTGIIGTNVSGVSDCAPLDRQAEVIRELFPDAGEIGLLFCPDEVNSRYQINVIKGYLTEMGYNCTEYTFTGKSDVESVTRACCEKSDVIYIPTDNVAASNAETISSVILPAKKPAVCGEEGLCKVCGAATLSVDYYDLGVTAGKMAAKILKGVSKVSEMPIEYPAAAEKKYNPAVCAALGMTVPSDYAAIE